MADNILTVDSNVKDQQDKNFKTKACVFLATVTGVSALAGFAHTLSQAKKNDPFFQNNNGLGKPVVENGAMLALRALGWGTVYAVGGVGLLSYGIWKFSGARDLKDFRQIVGSKLPRLTKTEHQGRTEFNSFRELMQFLIEDGGKISSTGQEK